MVALGRVESGRDDVAAAAARLPHGRPAEVPRVLVVEDDADVRELLSDVLNRAGYLVATATDAASAVTAARQRPPALVLLDLQLPGGTGLGVCRQIRADPRTRDVPIVILTAYGSELTASRGFDAGADVFMTKPFSPADLIAQVDALLSATAPGA